MKATVKVEELMRRVDPNVTISIDPYALGLLNIVDFLVVELERLMKEEDRYKGIVKTYLANIDSTFKRVYIGRTIKETEVLCKILYLYKPLIISEYKRLTKRKLSGADTVITIIRKILMIVEEEAKNFKYLSETKTLEKIIGKLWENIRHKVKNDPLYYISYQMKSFMLQGMIGKYPQDSFTFLRPYTEKSPLEKPGTRGIDLDSGKTIDL